MGRMIKSTKSKAASMQPRRHQKLAAKEKPPRLGLKSTKAILRRAAIVRIGGIDHIRDALTAEATAFVEGLIRDAATLVEYRNKRTIRKNDLLAAIDSRNRRGLMLRFAGRV
jgi:histone H3/H4